MQRTPLAWKACSFVGESIKMILEADVVFSGAVGSARVTVAPSQGVTGTAASRRAEGLRQSHLPAGGHGDTGT